jgi:hypothetical protein
MADILCGYTADRDETLVAYLYGDIEPWQRAAFDAHIATCERCRHELADLQGVREQLEVWTAPEMLRPLAVPAPSPSRPVASAGAGPGWREIPAWAQVAAALLALGVSAGLGGAIAHLDVRYERGSLTLRTGWSRAASPDSATPTSASRAGSVATVAARPAPWQTDVEGLERRLRAEMQQSSAASATAIAARPDATATAEAQLLRKARALVEDSERRQRNELALRIAEVVQEFDTKRGTDLANIRSMKTIQSATDLAVVRQQQWINLLTQASVRSR